MVPEGDYRWSAQPALGHNDPEFISTTLRLWAQQHGATLIHIQPGKSTQDVYIKRFTRTSCTEVLDSFLFITLDEVRRMAED